MSHFINQFQQVSNFIAVPALDLIDLNLLYRLKIEIMKIL